MNIFILDENPNIAAQYHNDVHVNKMILESAQILSTTKRIVDNIPDDTISILYKKTHINHPCCIWARQSKENYLWLYNLFHHLIAEKKYRTDKLHACFKLVPELYIPPVNSISRGLTTFALAMPDIYKSIDIIKSYRLYYIAEKREDKRGKNIAIWTKRGQPSWWK